MARQKKPTIKHAEIVQRFAERLREMRRARGMTQVELSRRASVSESYIRRLESAGAAPGIDMLDRLAVAIGTTATDLLPVTKIPDDLAVVREQARMLFEGLMVSKDHQTLSLLTQLLARLSETTPH
jgi:transcriptional regulator with XRE-family HTH domain